jgi:hypothetical protein
MMKLIEPCGWMVILSLSTVAAVAFEKEMPLPGTLHSFHMDNGDTRHGYVVGGKEESIRIHVQLSHAEPSGDAVVSVLLKQKSILKVIPLQWEIWESAVEEGNQKTLEQGWKAMNSLLGLPGARVGWVGNALADSLVKTQNPASENRIASKSSPDNCLQMAQALHALIEEKSHCPEERAAARAGRLRIRMLQGKYREVADEAETWVEESPPPPFEAWDILGESLLLEAENLVQEHPRWEQDRFVKPKMIALLNGALDASLIGFVRHPVRENYAARGLLRSARIYSIWGNSKLSEQSISDVRTFYPRFRKQNISGLENPEQSKKDDYETWNDH